MKTDKKFAFTIIELLVVISIISILSLIVVYSFDRVRKNSRDAQRKADLSSIASALEFYKTDKKKYPSSDFADKLTKLSNIVPNYLANIPTDPERSTTQSEYQYKSDGNQYKIVATAPESLSGVDDSAKAKKIAGDFFDPKTITRFQISTSETALNW